MDKKTLVRTELCYSLRKHPHPEENTEVHSIRFVFKSITLKKTGGLRSTAAFPNVILNLEYGHIC